MKLTLWQQFSSNHSSSFTVVGTFESPQKAQSAATQLNALFKEVFRWYDKHPGQKALDMYDPPTSPERAIIEQFNIQTDWNLGVSSQSVRKSLSIKATEHILLLHISATSWNHAHENLAKLVSKFGSLKTGRHSLLDSGIYNPGLNISLNAQAPDGAVGRRVYDEIRTAIDHIDPDEDELVLPWVEHCYISEMPTVEWDGHILTISAGFKRLADNLLAFIAHLKVEGFTDFDLEFTEIVD